jgi:ABC-2 type transport system ATP-binding protein
MAMQSNTNERQPRGAAASISMENVSKSFGEKRGIRNVTLDVQRGTMMSLVGPSVCGKSTVIRLLTGVYSPDSGTVRVLGEQPGGRNFQTRTRTRIGYLPQQYVLSKHMTVANTMRFVSSLYGLRGSERKQRLGEALKLVNLDQHTDARVGNLSGGMQRRLALACTLAHAPEVIFADEPTAGLDPDLRERFWEHFCTLRDQGQTLFITTQYLDEILYCVRVAVICDGTLLYIDTPDGLRRRAIGGDALVLTVHPPDVFKTYALIKTSVDDVRLSSRREGVVFVTVANAGTDLPRLLGMLKDNAIDILEAKEYRPSYDEVFSILMKRDCRRSDPLEDAAIRL